jgi:hypothetical protein
VVAFSRGRIHIDPYVSHYLDDALEWLGLMSPAPAEWRRFVAHWRYTGSTDPKDDMYCTWDISNITGGALDSSWTTTDYTTCESKFDTFFGAIASNQEPHTVLIEYKWYVRSYNDYGNSHPFAPHGPPVRVTPKGIAGTAGGTLMPPQAAISVTEKTPYPRNWGRFYIPGLGSAVVDTATPSIKNTVVDSICAATQTLYSGLASSDFQVVVPVTSLGTGPRGSPGAGTPNRTLVNVTQIQVDSSFDVIRRRRSHTTRYRKDLP